MTQAYVPSRGMIVLSNDEPPAKRCVLGIDAAWTLRQPSGVALAAEHFDGWQVVAAAPSYEHFLALTEGGAPKNQRPCGSMPDAPALLASASILAGRDFDLVAIDMPLSHEQIVSRRTSDNQLSSAYGGRKCGTHTPSALRPGAFSTLLSEAFPSLGISPAD